MSASVRRLPALLPLIAAVVIACNRRDPPPSTPNTQSASELELLRTAIARSSPLPERVKCAGFDREREVLLGERHVVVLSCNRDGLVAEFAADGSLMTTHPTSGKPLVVSLFADDVDGAPSSPRGAYKESVFEITRDTVRPYNGRVE